MQTKSITSILRTSAFPKFTRAFNSDWNGKKSKMKRFILIRFVSSIYFSILVLMSNIHHQSPYLCSLNGFNQFDNQIKFHYSILWECNGPKMYADDLNIGFHRERVIDQNNKINRNQNIKSFCQCIARKLSNLCIGILCLVLSILFNHELLLMMSKMYTHT